VVREQHAPLKGKKQVNKRPADREFAYFVSFAHKGGFGSTEFWRKTPIESYEDVRSIVRDIEANGDDLGDVIILNWVRYPGLCSWPSTSTSDGSPDQRPSAAETER
jgi:hypothetical protein